MGIYSFVFAKLMEKHSKNYLLWHNIKLCSVWTHTKPYIVMVNISTLLGTKYEHFSLSYFPTYRTSFFSKVGKGFLFII